MLFIVSTLLSSLYYWRSMQIINLQSQRLQERIQFDLENDVQPRRAQMHAEIFETELISAHHQLQQQIVFINLLLLCFGAGASYLLAGKTLRPIEKAFAVQRRFVADAAHELKTPLTSLRTAIEVSLFDKKIGKTAQTVLGENLTDIINLQTLTESLLSLAKTQEGVRLERTAVSLPAAAQQVTDRLAALAKQKHIAVQIESSQNDLLVSANEQSLLRVLVILLDNAIKYSPNKSKIAITIKKHKRFGVIAISDQGDGIAPEHHKAIFERFYRVESARTKLSSVGGHGLGLAVAKELTNAMGGSISLKSEETQGSTFSIVLPVA
ncbi:MAG: HAMP domain-containing histidine kinase [Candidatus Pacebacteria bacterium]|nr:HAMP domain-containing histidine kinase [Candidatus Paceibacterota bacterium]